MNKGQVLLHLLQAFEAQGIPSVVVGDTRGYPAEIQSDADVVVAPEHLVRMPLLLERVAREQGWQIVQHLQHEQVAHYFVIAWRGETDTEYLAFDVCSNYLRRGRPLLTAASLLEGRVPLGNTGLYVPTPARAFLYYALKKIDKNALDDRQGAYLSWVWRQDPQGARREAARFWSSPLLDLLEGAAEQDHWAPVRQRLAALRAELNGALHVPVQAQLGERVRQVRRVLQPTGLCVAFLGPDGAGKSSVIGEVEKNVAPAFRRLKRYHLRPSFGRGRPSGEIVSNPHGKAPRGPGASLAKLLLWLADYTVGSVPAVRLPLVRSTLVIFDRYYHDLLVDARRYRYGGPAWLAGLVGRAVPRPDLFIFLDLPAEVAHARKPEVPLEEGRRLRERYRQLARQLPNAHVVDAERPLDEVAREVETIILHHLQKRTGKRLGLV